MEKLPFISVRPNGPSCVTLENANLLQRHFGIADTVLAVASCMREFGVRKDNVKLNTGKNAYAFNAIQRRLLPEDYRP